MGRRRDDRIDRAIQVGSLQLLAEKGYHGFSVERLCARLGIAKSIVYSRWPSRQSLLLAVLANHVGRMTTSLPADGPPSGRQLAVALRSEIGLASGSLGRAIALASLTAEDGAGADHGSLARALAQRREAMANLLRDALDRRELAPGSDCDLLADFLLGAVWGALVLGRSLPPADAERLVILLCPPAG